MYIPAKSLELSPKSARILPPAYLANRKQVPSTEEETQHFRFYKLQTAYQMAIFVQPYQSIDNILNLRQVNTRRIAKRSNSISENVPNVFITLFESVPRSIPRIPPHGTCCCREPAGYSVEEDVSKFHSIDDNPTSRCNNRNTGFAIRCTYIR